MAILFLHGLLIKGKRKHELLLRGEAVNEKAIHKLNEVVDDVLNKNIYPMFEKSQTLEDIYEHTISKVPEKRLVYHLGLGHAKIRKMIVMGLIKHKDYEVYKTETISLFENNIDNQRNERTKNIIRLFTKTAINTAKILEERYLS